MATEIQTVAPAETAVPIIPTDENSLLQEDGSTKKIYIVLSQTGTLLSRVLKIVTHSPYNHSSIALQEDLQTMYSFGRLRPYNPFWGGFVCESPTRGTFKRFKNTRIRVLEIHVSAYDMVCEIIRQMMAEQERYRYNYWGLILAAIRVPVKRQYRYYCSEFVKYLALRMALPEADHLPAIVKPMHLLSIPHTIVYEGILREYDPEGAAVHTP